LRPPLACILPEKYPSRSGSTCPFQSPGNARQRSSHSDSRCHLVSTQCPFTKSLFSRLRFSAASEGSLSIRLDGTNLPEALPLPEKVANHIEGLRRQETPTCKGKKSYPAIAAVAYSSRGISSAAAPFLDIGCVQADEFVRGGYATDNELSQYQQQKERVDSQYTLQGGARIFLIARGHRGRMEDLPFLQNLDLRASSAYLE
jgi:hypothetical protein